MLTDILNRLGVRAVERVRNELTAQDKVVSGETANSVRYVLTETGLEVRAKASIMTLVLGRKPTTNKGDGQVLAKIKQWCKDRGIPEKYAYPITKRIHEQGIQVPNKYTQGDLLQKAFAGFEDEIKKELTYGYTIFSQS